MSTALLLAGCKNKNNQTDENCIQGEGYYAEINSCMGDGENGELREALTKLVHPGQTPTYSGDTGTYCLSKVLQEADADPNNSKNMIFFYTQKSNTKDVAHGDSYWNREHVWPQSLSNGCWGQARAGSDMLHLRPTYKETNESRGNMKYGNASGSWLTYNGMPYGRKGQYFEPVDAIKGDCARIIMYLWVAYHDEYANLPGIKNVFESIDVMLQWHLNDAPSQIEINRNNYAQNSKQGNRNPFVDHPEYACKIWGASASPETQKRCGM